MRKCIFTFLMLTTAAVYSQSLKNYSGKYENGTATYQYYENENYERILSGNFLYKVNDYTITGQFKNNLRTGLWKATLTEKDNNTSQLTSEAATANYIDGKLDGICSYTKTEVTTKKILAKSTASFKGNIAVGSYSYIVYGNKENVSINFNLNQEGFADSTCTIKYSHNGKQFEHIQKYNNGFLFWELHRDMTDGSIIKKTDRKKLIDEFYSTYDTLTKISIIPYVEFQEHQQPIYISHLDKGLDGSDYLSTPKKNSDTVYYSNAPFTFVRRGFSNVWDFWDVTTGINFWTEHSEYIENPIYMFKKGIHKALFSPVKELALEDKEYKIYVLKKTISENKKIRQQLLDSLKSALLSSIDWVDIKDSSQSLVAFSISAIPITKSQYLGYENFKSYRVENFSDDYFGDYESVHNATNQLEEAIEVIKTRRVINTVYNRYSNDPSDYKVETRWITGWTGVRIASDKEVKYSTDNGFIKPIIPNNDYQVYWFAK